MESPGRNAPCPCGSGKKYKLCCLRSEAPGGGSIGGIPEADADPNRGMLRPVGPALEKVVEVVATPILPSQGRAREMDRGALEAIQDAMRELHMQLAREHGLIVRQKKHSYSKWNSQVEFEVAVEREDGIVMGGLAESFLERCGDYSLVPEDLGRPFQSGDRTFRITGLRPRAKLPILCEQLDPESGESLGENVEHRFEPSVVRHHLHECPGQAGTTHQH